MNLSYRNNPRRLLKMLKGRLQDFRIFMSSLCHFSFSFFNTHVFPIAVAIIVTPAVSVLHLLGVCHHDFNLLTQRERKRERERGERERERRERERERVKIIVLLPAPLVLHASLPRRERLLPLFALASRRNRTL